MAGIGQAVRALRQDADLTQEELADRSGLSVRTISDIERGLRRRLYSDTADRLADALGLDAAQREAFLERARGRGDDAVELGEGFRRRFVQWHLERIEALGGRVGSEEQWYAVLDADEANLDVALRWADEAGDSESVLRIACGLWQYWQARGALAKGRKWLARGLVPETDPARRLIALWGLAWLAYEQADYDAAAATAAELAELAAATDDPLARRHALTVTGNVALATDRPDDAVRDFTEALGFAEKLDAPWILATSHLTLAVALLGADRPDESRGETAVALRIYEELGDERFRAHALGYLALAALIEGDPQRARSLYAQCLAAFEALAEPKGTAEGLSGLAAVAAASGESRRAAALAGAAERLRETFAGRPMPVEQRRYAALLAQVSANQPLWDAWWIEGRALRLDDAIALALGADE